MYSGLWMSLMVAVATQPTTVATTQALDLSTPRSALTALIQAMETGNAEQIRQVLYPRAAGERRMIEALIRLSRAVVHLGKTANTTFGESGAKVLLGDANTFGREAETQIKWATEKVSGNTATLSVPGYKVSPVVLEKIDGQWRIPMSELAKGISDIELDQRLGALSDQAAIIDRVADQIAAGRFHTGQEAAEYMHKQMIAAAADAGAAPLPSVVPLPTTRPAAP